METFAATAAVLPESAAARWRRDRLFYAGVTVAAFAVVLTGFGPSYYFAAFTGAPVLASLVHVHAALYSIWMILFAVQVSLVAASRVALHRKLGTLSVALAIAMVLAAWLMSVEGARFLWAGPRNPRDAEAALRFLIVPLGDLVLFVGFFGAAFLFRRRPDTHKRLVVLAMIGGVIAPAFGRLPIAVTVVVWSGLLLAGPLYDRLSRGRIHRAYAWGVPIVFFSMPLRLAIAQTDTWRRVATWVIS